MEPRPEQMISLTRNGEYLLLTVACILLMLIALFLYVQMRESRAARRLELELLRQAALQRLSRPCEGCGGAGTVNRIVDAENNGLPRRVKCPRCAGAGRIQIGDAPAVKQ